MQENYYELMGLKVDYQVDLERLNQNYLEVQRSVHPDKFANSTDLERRLSVQKAALINDAIETLKNPLKRAIYHLSLFQIELKDNETSVDPMFLMEQMELREKLAGIKQDDDPFAALDEMLAQVNAKLKAFQESFIKLFAEPKAENLEQAKTQVLKMQFIEKLKQECLDLEEELSNEF